MTDPGSSAHPSDEGPDGALTPVAAHREALEAAALALERSLAAPTVESSWRSGVAEALHSVVDVLTEHVSRNDTMEGLPGSIVEAAPRLAGPARRLSAEHAELTNRAASFGDMLDDPTTAPESIRDAGADLSGRLLAHVHTANDLMHDAFEAEPGND